MYAEKKYMLSINEPVINSLDKVDIYYTQDKWRITFGCIKSLHIY